MYIGTRQCQISEMEISKQEIDRAKIKNWKRRKKYLQPDQMKDKKRRNGGGRFSILAEGAEKGWDWQEGEGGGRQSMGL